MSTRRYVAPSARLPQAVSPIHPFILDRPLTTTASNTSELTTKADSVLGSESNDTYRSTSPFTDTTLIHNSLLSSNATYPIDYQSHPLTATARPVEKR